MKKKATVHLIEAYDKLKFYIGKRGNELKYITGPEPWSDISWSHNHLYLTTDDDFKDGDWVITEDTIVWKYNNKHLLSNQFNFKVIATTNPELWPYNRSNTWEHNEAEFNDGMGKIPESFIQQYVDSQGSIKKVMVEYDYKDKHLVVGLKKEDAILPRIPKLNSQGEIIIHPIEEKMYTRKELEEIVLELGRCIRRTGKELPEHKIKEWLKESYPL